MVDVLPAQVGLGIMAPVEFPPAEAPEDDLTNLLDECDRVMQGEDLGAIMTGFGETSEASCEDVYFACAALARERQRVGRKQLV